MKEFWNELNLLQKIVAIIYGVIVVAAHVAVFWALIDITILAPGAWMRAIVLVIYTLLIALDSIVVTSIFFV